MGKLLLDQGRFDRANKRSSVHSACPSIYGWLCTDFGIPCLLERRVLTSSKEVHWAFRLGHDSQQDFAADFKNWLLVNYIIEPFYTLSVGFTKFSIIFMYFRLFGTLKWMQISCRFTLALVGLWTVACVIIGLIQCIPVRKAWDITIEGGCVDISIFFICQRATNLVTDLILPALPIKVVLGLNASIAKRLSLVFGFCMGGLSVENIQQTKKL